MPAAGDEVIVARSARFGYTSTPVVDGVDLTVRSGEVVALVGTNGSGKSTLVKGLLGLNRHLGGEVRIGGGRIGSRPARATLGYVPQRHTVSESMAATAAEVVAIGRLPHRRLTGRLGARDRAIVAQSLDLVGLGDRARDNVRAFSGGQQRRVLIARALASEAPVLLMDEPTAGVDPSNQRVLLTVLERLVARGVTLLIVTHELDMLHAVVTRVVRMDDGHVTSDGSLDVFLAERARHLAAEQAHLRDVHGIRDIADADASFPGTSTAASTVSRAAGTRAADAPEEAPGATA